MSDVLLAVIAVSVLTMAIIQVAAIMLAARAAKRVRALSDRIERDIQPIIANLTAISADAARTSAVAAAAVERADQAVQDVARKVDQALSSIPSLVESAREGANIVAGLRAILNAFRDARSGGRSRPSHVDDEDALFIG